MAGSHPFPSLGRHPQPLCPNTTWPHLSGWGANIYFLVAKMSLLWYFFKVREQLGLGQPSTHLRGTCAFLKWKCFYKLAVVGESLDVWRGSKLSIFKIKCIFTSWKLIFAFWIIKIVFWFVKVRKQEFNIKENLWSFGEVFSQTIFDFSKLNWVPEFGGTPWHITYFSLILAFQDF